MQGAYIEFGGWQAGWGLQGLAWNTLEEEALCQPLHVLTPFTELCHHCRTAHCTALFNLLHCTVNLVLTWQSHCSALWILFSPDSHTAVHCFSSTAVQCRRLPVQCSAESGGDYGTVQIWRRLWYSAKSGGDYGTVQNLEETMVQCRIWRRQPRTDPTQSSSCTTTNYHTVLQLQSPLLKAAAPSAM